MHINTHIQEAQYTQTHVHTHTHTYKETRGNIVSLEPLYTTPKTTTYRDSTRERSRSTHYESRISTLITLITLNNPITNKPESPD